MTYDKPEKHRVQVLIDQERFQQLTTLAELTNSSVSRIVRLALDSKADEFAKEIKQRQQHKKQTDWAE